MINPLKLVSDFIPVLSYCSLFIEFKVYHYNRMVVSTHNNKFYCTNPLFGIDDEDDDEPEEIEFDDSKKLLEFVKKYDDFEIKSATVFGERGETDIDIGK
jgi:hypothetical protein